MRLAAEDRRKQILDAAVLLAMQTNYQTITRAAVADRAGCAQPLIAHYFTNIQSLKGAVLVNAIENKNERILAQAVINEDPRIADVAKEILNQALRSFEL